jgi:Family of unknown function (DUF6529)
LEQLIEDVTRGNVTEVKVMLASVVLALALYQVLLAAVAYGRIRLPFLAAASASWTHRFSGDAIVVITVIVATMCIGYSGFAEGGAHAVVATVLLGVLATKVFVVRVGGRLGRLLPVLGVSVLLLFGITWLTSAGDFLGVG